MVKAQVESQIKVRDLSAAKLTIAPAGHSSWSEARTDLVSERKTKLRAEASHTENPTILFTPIVPC
ncbi:hypothetical protein N9S30_00625 [bacterium]|nr:hypothetical protein [bacterium]